MASFRLSEWLKGSVRVDVRNDGQQQVLRELTAKKVAIWNVKAKTGQDYCLYVGMPELGRVLAAARKHHAKLRFSEKRGLPVLLWHARRRKVFLAGAGFFVAILYMLSSFIWHVEVTGTDQPEEIEQALGKLNIYPGSLLYRVLEQDEVQLALLEQLPNISWVGVKIQGTSVFVRVIPRIPPAKNIPTRPQEIVATVPGVVANVLAVKGKVVVKPGEYVSPGTVLIAGLLDNGTQVHAAGVVEGIVWYRTELTMPLKTMLESYTGRFVKHDYLVFGGLPIMVWGFSHPPFQQENVVSAVEPVQLGPFSLPIAWRVDTVYEVARRANRLSASSAVLRSRQYSTAEVMRITPTGSKVMRQNILQHKVEHGNLYMTVWSEVLQEIGKPQPLGRNQ